MRLLGPAVLLALLLALNLGPAAAAPPPPPEDCFDCPWLELPLDEWTAQAGNSSRRRATAAAAAGAAAARAAFAGQPSTA